MSTQNPSPNPSSDPRATSSESEAATENTAQNENLEAAQDVDPQEDLDNRIETMAADLAAMEDRWKRSEAEKQNFITRAEKEKSDIRDYAVQKFAKDLVGEIDNLQRALAALPPASKEDSDNLKAVRKGLESTEKSFLSMLERHGVTRENPVGKAFDPHQHEALQQMHSQEHAPGYVMMAHNPVWKLKNRLLKPAMVVVAADSSTGEAPKAK
ncbi:heat shock protein [Lasius niger]|uniref:Heat shock protein n=1 Tax=Lasius niger TaxID=67767 RepID=A0A0J7NBN6_LASNI|nr:heat shock protein [Lasius niger]